MTLSHLNQYYTFITENIFTKKRQVPCHAWHLLRASYGKTIRLHTPKNGPKAIHNLEQWFADCSPDVDWQSISADWTKQLINTVADPINIHMPIICIHVNYSSELRKFYFGISEQRTFVLHVCWVSNMQTSDWNLYGFFFQ